MYIFSTISFFFVIYKILLYKLISQVHAFVHAAHCLPETGKHDLGNNNIRSINDIERTVFYS